MRKFVSIVTFLLIGGFLAAKPVALKKFLETGFIQEFDSIANRAEKSVRDFKAIQGMYSEEDVIRVKETYDAAAKMFNAALFNIKDDLLTKDKRKYILKYPEDYSKQMMLDLYQAKEFYENDYGLVLDEVTEGKVDNIFPFAAIITAYNLAVKGVEIFRQVKEKWDNINEDILNEFLIDRHRFKYWDEINSGSSSN